MGKRDKMMNKRTSMRIHTAFTHIRRKENTRNTSEKYTVHSMQMDG